MQQEGIRKVETHPINHTGTPNVQQRYLRVKESGTDNVENVELHNMTLQFRLKRGKDTGNFFSSGRNSWIEPLADEIDTITHTEKDAHCGDNAELGKRYFSDQIELDMSAAPSSLE